MLNCSGERGTGCPGGRCGIRSDTAGAGSAPASIRASNTCLEGDRLARASLMVSAVKDREAFEPAQAKIFAPFETPLGPPHVWEALEERAKCNLPFDACERCAEAKMSSPAERQMAIVLARKIERIWKGEAARVAIGRSHDSNDGVPPPNLLAAEIEVLGRDTGRVLAWAFVTQELLHAGLEHAFVVAHACESGRIPQEREEAIADEVGGRLLSA